MPRGIFTQCCTLLLEEGWTVETLAAVLREFDPEVLPPLEPPKFKHDAALDEQMIAWMGRDRIWMPMANSSRGQVVVDVVEQKWPDQMGNGEGEDALFIAWSMGQFGPSTFPGSLQRAQLQQICTATARAAARRHTAFIRIRTTHIRGQTESILPDDYDAWVELNAIQSVLAPLIHLPGVLAYFNPNGEALWESAYVGQLLEEASRTNDPPLPLWIMPRCNMISSEQYVTDTIGMEQFGLLDVEAVLSQPDFGPDELVPFVFEFSDKLLSGMTFKTQDVVEGPGGLWRMRLEQESIGPPPREVLRLTPHPTTPPPLPRSRSTA